MDDFLRSLHGYPAMWIGLTLGAALSMLPSWGVLAALSKPFRRTRPEEAPPMRDVTPRD